MKKNLKKVISAVIAFAVAGSMIPASFAAKVALTDVAETASYATAVDTLVALGVINGYEDGTFKPDNNITRAEVTKVVVAALNNTDVAEGMKGATSFSDVAADHWAAGFINAGVSEGFINGMGDGTFAPGADVTYAQVVKMLVCTLGYEEYAQYMGGWPNGYLNIANSEGVTKGVSANANDPATRAQVAQLVFNALQTPMVQNTGMVYSAANGGFVPNIAKMDGTDDNYYKTLLTEKFDAYLVEGYVIETSKNGTLKADEVNFGIAKSEKYEESDFTTGKDNKVWKSAAETIANNTVITCKVGDTEAADYVDTYAQAIIMVDQYNDYIILSFVPSGKNKSVKFKTDWIDTDEYAEDSNGNYVYAGQKYLEYNASESATKSTKYNLDRNGIKLYVNGVSVEATNDNISKYVVNNNVGEVELVDSYKTDGYYDIIYVNDYVSAQVSSVTLSTGKVQLKSVKNANGNGTSLELDDENDDLTYNIYYNGEKITLAELKKDDVLSIACDVTKDWTKSNFYDIYVSRDVKTEKLTGKNDTDRKAKFTGVEYSFVSSYSSAMSGVNLGDEYELYLDTFGRIFKMELNESSDKYAVIDKFTLSSSEDDYRATLYTVDGQQKVYTIDSAKATIAVDGVKESLSTKTAVQNFVKNKVYVGGSSSNGKVDVKDRVVKYKVSSSTGYITSLDFVTAGATADKANDKFNGRTNAIGSVKMDTATKIIDAIEYKSKDYDKVADLSIATVASFNDDKGYTAYAYGDRRDGAYPFVLVVEGAAPYNEYTRFAVVSGATSQITDEDGDEVYEIKAYYKSVEDDSEKKLIASDDVETEAMALNVGDVIIFTTNAKGYIDKLDVISNWNGKLADYSDMVAASIANQASFVALPAAADCDDYSADFANIKKADSVEILYGPIVDVTEKNLALGKVATGKKTPLNDRDYVFDIALSSATNAYIYDYSKSKNNRIGAISAEALPFAEFDETNTVGDVIDWNSNIVDGKEQNSNIERVNFAFVLVVDGEAADVLVLAAK